MRRIIWFRRDLRVSDNIAFSMAAKDSDIELVAVFLWCHDTWKRHGISDVQITYIYQNLILLQAALQALNIPFYILDSGKYKQAPQVLLDFAKSIQAQSLFFNREYIADEMQRDKAVQAHFKLNGLNSSAFHDDVLLPPDEIKTKTGGVYTVFTPFKKAVIAKLMEQESSVLAVPKKRSACALQAPKVESLNLTFQEDKRAGLYEAGEHVALRQLDFFLKQVDHYKINRDIPSINGTSRISHHLAIGTISNRRCLYETLASNNGKWTGGSQGFETYIGELIWREFYRYITFHFPRIVKNKPFKQETDAVQWRHDKTDFAAWCEGRTGFPIVDAAMRQLNQTAWMHNRLRMIVAMFLTKDLLIDWRWGEQYFMANLIDADFCSNNGGWQWSASTGTDAAPYFRVFSPTLQSQKVDPQALFIKEYVPELRQVSAAEIHAFHDGGMRFGVNYPGCIVNHNEARLRVLAAFKAAKE